LLLVLVLVFFAYCNVHIVSSSSPEQIINLVNKLQPGWTASDNPHVLNKIMKGAFMGRDKDPNPLPYLVIEADTEQAIPTSFDSREQWPGCIGMVLNQGDCGSCWAFGTCEVLSDRFCIQSNGSVHVQLSELDLVACDTSDEGCNGGWPSNAWLYATNSGLVTDDCIPYNQTIPTCPPSQQPCLNFVPTPPCPSKCSNGDNWDTDLHYASTSYAISSKISDIQSEMMKNGPIQATFSVYEDFLQYKSGVYKHVTGEMVGGHSVKIIGWGVQNNQNYWLVQNSWTSTWGMDGYFMILRGVDECGIESGLVAGQPKL